MFQSGTGPVGVQGRNCSREHWGLCPRLLLPVGAVSRGSGQEASSCAESQVGHNCGAGHRGHKAQVSSFPGGQQRTKFNLSEMGFSLSRAAGQKDCSHPGSWNGWFVKCIFRSPICLHVCLHCLTRRQQEWVRLWPRGLWHTVQPVQHSPSQSCVLSSTAHTAQHQGSTAAAHPALQHALTTALTVITNHNGKITADTMGH